MTHPHQRATGTLHLAFKHRDGITALADLRQQGCAKARFPRPTDWLEAITLNTSGGVAGGDVISATIDVQNGARATIATQAAERFYRALPSDPPARLRSQIAVASGAACEYLPQESILFDQAALDRRLEIDLAEGAWFLGLETLVFGRASMGETVAHLRLRDVIRVRIAGRLVLHDAVRLDGAPKLQDAAVALGARAMTTLVHVADDIETRLPELREALTPFEAAASAWNGILVARFLAPDSAALRHSVLTALDVLRNGRSMPRVWQC